LFAKGVAYGVAVIALNSLLLHLTMKYFVSRQKRFVALTFVLFYALRYAVLGGLLYVFLANRWGSPVGLLVGIGVGLVAFLATRKFY
jgi:hypothetical protein